MVPEAGAGSKGHGGLETANYTGTAGWTGTCEATVGSTGSAFLGRHILLGQAPVTPSLCERPQCIRIRFPTTWAATTREIRPDLNLWRARR